jgi:preprotein translocase subunit YajC|tara:strand:- start:219 stop:488 length:270 start_codon:yes stop_codon:yes gene_type:complete
MEKTMEALLGNQFLPLIAMVAVFYFLMIRPKQKQAKEREAMLSKLVVGDKVLTYASIIGSITKIDEQNFTLKTGESNIEFSRAAIQKKI